MVRLTASWQGGTTTIGRARAAHCGGVLRAIVDAVEPPASCSGLPGGPVVWTVRRQPLAEWCCMSLVGSHQQYHSRGPNPTRKAMTRAYNRRSVPRPTPTK